MHARKIKGHTNFTIEDIDEIVGIGRMPWGSPERDAREVAKRFRVGIETIRRIWRGDTFTGVTGGGDTAITEAAFDTKMREEMAEGLRIFAKNQPGFREQLEEKWGSVDAAVEAAKRGELQM